MRVPAAATPLSCSAVPLTHQVQFQGSGRDAADALEHYLARLADIGAAVTAVAADSLDTDRSSAAQVQLLLPDTTTALLSISVPANPAYVDAFTYIASLTVTAPGRETDIDSGLVRALCRELDLLPLTRWELRDIRRQFPLTQQFAASCGPDAMRDLAFVMAIHHVGDFVAMMDALTAMGADPRHMTILDKGYPYTQRHRVDGWLRSTLGLCVEHYPDRERVIGEHIARAAAAGRKTMIFDDGGHTWPVVASRYPEAMDQFAGIVEQTMSGIWKLDGVPLPVPVFSVAESQLKAAVESYGVALAAVRSLQSRLPQEKFEGRPALVLGYGRIGRQIAHILRSLRMRVAVYDSATVALVTAHEEGFATSRSLTGLIESHQPLLVVGSAGRGSLTGEHLGAFRKSAYLVSVTSRTYEFELEKFAAAAKQVKDYGRLGHGYLLDDDVELCVVAHGMPVNFYHAESLPNRYIDLVISALLLGGVTLARPDRGGFQPGHNLARTNAVLNASPALETYYDWYGEPSARRDLLTPGAEAGDFAGVPWTFLPV
jgi:S-adenosylhomocysteine hydrolase